MLLNSFSYFFLFDFFFNYLSLIRNNTIKYFYSVVCHEMTLYVVVSKKKNSNMFNVFNSSVRSCKKNL